jgi:hypothetical protein
MVRNTKNPPTTAAAIGNPTSVTNDRKSIFISPVIYLVLYKWE